MPLLITVAVHVVLIGIAGAVVVQQNGAAKKKTFTASAGTEAPKQVEHRIQVARRGGASGGATSPVSANRIYSTAQNALSMPEMPELPANAAGGFGGFGGMGSGVGLGAGVGTATSLGAGTALGGRGFMSLSFLGITSQNASRIVFVVDTSRTIMDLRKGGFQAFAIIRQEIMNLVGRLPPSAQFNVVLFQPASGRAADINLFQPSLVPATSDNKKEFFAWMQPVNAKLDSFGPQSATRSIAWKTKPLPSGAGIDERLLPPVWVHGVHAALEQNADTIFVITGTDGTPWLTMSESARAARELQVAKRRREFEAEVAGEGLVAPDVINAYNRAIAKASRELEAANRRLEAEGKDPIIIGDGKEIMRPDVQAALKRNGIGIALDKTGWSKRNGEPIEVPWLGIMDRERAPWTALQSHLARLQRALVPSNATINMFLFVGPEDKPAAAIENLTGVSKRNAGKFQLLTTKRLEEMTGAETNSDPAATSKAKISE